MTRYSRRETLRGLVIGASAGTGLLLALEGPISPGRSDIDADVEDTLATVAEAVYPSAIEDPEPFVAAYLAGLSSNRMEELTRTLADLDTASRDRFHRPLSALSVSDIDDLLRTTGVHRVEPAPDGTLPARTRFHLVNGLLFVLFTDPAGSGLVGINNPRGYPGGFATALSDSGGGE